MAIAKQPQTASGNAEPLADRLWHELEDEDGDVQPDAMTPEWLDSVRRRIQKGDLPAFITPDYRTGWQHYARNRITDLFIRRRTKDNGARIRRYFPVIADTLEARAEWLDAEGHPDLADEHAARLLERHVRSAILLHGSARVARGKATWAEVQQSCHEIVNDAVEDGQAQSEETTD